MDERNVAQLAVEIAVKEAEQGGYETENGNTWSGTTFENRREGVYVLQSTKVAACTFIRLV